MRVSEEDSELSLVENPHNQSGSDSQRALRRSGRNRNQVTYKGIRIASPNKATYLPSDSSLEHFISIDLEEQKLSGDARTTRQSRRREVKANHKEPEEIEGTDRVPAEPSRRSRRYANSSYIPVLKSYSSFDLYKS